MMNNISKTELKALFESVGWAQGMTAEELYDAVKHFSHYIFERADDGFLIGFARSMDDGIYSANIDIVVVHSMYQGRDIAKRMILRLLKQLEKVKYISVSPN